MKFKDLNLKIGLNHLVKDSTGEMVIAFVLDAHNNPDPDMNGRHVLVVPEEDILRGMRDMIEEALLYNMSLRDKKKEGTSGC